MLHLGAILEKMLNTITDGDPAVRQALVALLELVIPQFELETLSAYFPIIRVYMLAGLTRIQTRFKSLRKKRNKKEKQTK